MMLSLSTVDRVRGFRLETTAKLIVEQNLRNGSDQYEAGVRGSVKGRTRIRPGVSINGPHPDEDATGQSLHRPLTRDRRQRANPPFPTCENAYLGSQLAKERSHEAQDHCDS